jgi:peptide deformylase
MAIRNIIIGADAPTLRVKTTIVTSFNKALKTLVQDLFDTVESAKGAGLAAPQIGETNSVAIVRVSGSFIPIINPRIVWASKTIELGEEGCLSLPGVWLYIPRPITIIMHFLDGRGREHESKLTGWDARVVQHEIDHLHGKLIVDYHAKGAEDPGQAL